MQDSFLPELFAVFLAAVPTVILAYRFKLPPLVAFILTGIFIGPHGLNLINNHKDLETIAEMGVACLLFSIGLELSFSKLESVKKIAFIGGGLQIILTGFLGPAFAWALGWSFHEQIYFGCMVALSSTALVMSVLSQQRQVDSLAGRVSGGVLLMQDLSIAPILIFLPLISKQDSVQVGAMIFLVPLAKVVGLFFLLFILSKFLLNPFMYWVAKPRSRELFLCWNLAFAIGLSLLTELLGFSFGFGAFLAGLLLSQTPYRFQVLSEMSPFRYAFSSIFFISVGTLVQIPFVWTHLPILLLLTFFIWIFKAFFTALSLRIAGLTLAVAIQVGLSLGQVGEFSFLILSMGQNHGVLKDEFYQMTLSLVSLTLILTPLMVKLSPMLVKRIRKYQKVSHELKSEHYQNHVIICGFGPLGQALGRMLQTHQIPFVVLELNPQTVQSHQGKIPIFFGDGSSEEILFESGVEQARALVVAAPDFINSVSIIEQARRMNANLTIITRARYRSEVSDLYQAGADIVISEELEGAIEMGKYLLLDLKVSEKEVHQFVKEIRDFGSADFF